MAAALRFAPLAREPLRPKYIKIRRKEFHERGTHEFCDMVVVRFIPGPPPSGCHGEHHALAVLKGDGERGRTIDATGFLRETRHQRADISSVDLAPDVISFSAAMSACVNGEEWDKALSLLRQMREAPGVELRARDLQVAILACKGSGGWEQALELSTRSVRWARYRT